MSTTETKVCPFCAETIKAAARGCRFCGHVFPPEGDADAGTRAAPATVAPPSPTAVAEPEVSDLLAGLVEKSLVLYEEDRQGHGRYRLLETVRQYARDRLLESQEGERIRGRHGAFFLRLAEEAEPRLRGPEQMQEMVRLNTEHENCRAALEWFHREEDGEEALRLAAALSPFWLMRGYFCEGRIWLETALRSPRALEQASSDHSASWRAKAFVGAGKLATGQGDCQAACRFLEDALAAARESRDPRDLLMAHAFLAPALVFQGKIEQACFHTAKTRRISQQLGDRSADGLCHFLLGLTALHRAEYQTAAQQFTVAVSCWREAGDRWMLALGLDYQGLTAYYRGDSKTAFSRLAEVEALNAELGSKLGFAWTAWQRGSLTEDQGDHRSALPHFEESLELFRQIGDIRGRGFALHSLGRAVQRLGDRDGARRRYQEGLEVFRQAQNCSGIAWVLSGLASLAMETGELARAARLFGAAAALPQTELPLFHTVRADYDRRLAETRAGLGEAAFAAAWSEGQAMSLEQAIEYALEQEETCP